MDDAVRRQSAGSTPSVRSSLPPPQLSVKRNTKLFVRRD
jgi:hypothetical protein